MVVRLEWFVDDEYCFDDIQIDSEDILEEHIMFARNLALATEENEVENFVTILNKLGYSSKIITKGNVRVLDFGSSGFTDMTSENAKLIISTMGNTVVEPKDEVTRNSNRQKSSVQQAEEVNSNE